MTTTSQITSLATLRDVLQQANSENEIALAAEHGLPTINGGIDWTELPTFGGTEPASTSEIWSWDATSLLVGTCADDLQIVSRDDA